MVTEVTEVSLAPCSTLELAGWWHQCRAALAVCPWGRARLENEELHLLSPLCEANGLFCIKDSAAVLAAVGGTFCKLIPSCHCLAGSQPLMVSGKLPHHELLESG